jgi:hypothetical protein
MDNGISMGLLNFKIDLDDFDSENQFVLDMNKLNIDVLNDFVLNIDQKAQLIAFLNTLTDYQASKDTRFSNPFKQ